MKIILTIGVIGSGKDYYADRYIHEHPSEKVILRKFATPLKVLVNAIVEKDLLNPAIYEAWKLHLPNREKLVALSTCMKSIFGNRIITNAAIEMLKADLKVYSNIGDNLTFIYTDCRFAHEIEAIAELASQYNIELKVVLCNYKSDRYQIIPSHPTEKLAIALIEDCKEELKTATAPIDITNFVLFNVIENPKYEFD